LSPSELATRPAPPFCLLGISALKRRILNTPNRKWETDKPNEFKREFSVAWATFKYGLRTEAEIRLGIKSAMRKIGAGLGMKKVRIEL
jgi:hypothetical protein